MNWIDRDFVSDEDFYEVTYPMKEKVNKRRMDNEDQIFQSIATKENEPISVVTQDQSIGK